MAYRPNFLTESYQHGQGVAQLLAAWYAPPTLQAAGLIHSFVWQGRITAEQIAETCGERVANLCQAYNKILQQEPVGPFRGNAHHLKRIKLFIAAYHDPALAFLGVASLWDHFILARQSEVRLQRHFSQEAENVLIPVLDMLGMWELKEEVEAWVMQQGAGRKDYQLLQKRLTQTEETRSQAFELINGKLQPVLPGAELSPKLRTPVQIYRPHLPEKTHTELVQKLTVDLIAETEAGCYEALHWIHHFWKPVEGRLRDYVGSSKLNGYRCLQTEVIVPLPTGHVRAHFHIRTQEMDTINRWGLAAVQMWPGHNLTLPQAWWSERKELDAKICSAPLGSLPETLYVFSPQGQVFGFHRGCTVVDYAYQVHSEVAHQCKRFTVNGEPVGPTTALRHLDLVELEQDPQFPGPNRVWLNAARTGRARSHIEKFINRRTQSSLRGQTVFERQLQTFKEHYRIDIPDHRLQQALNRTTRRLKLDRPEDLLAEIAAGRFASDSILHPLFSEEITRQVQWPEGVRLFPNQVNLAQCCKPRPGDDIVGRCRRRNQKIIALKIHRADCRYISDHQDTIPLGWRLQPSLTAMARLEMTALHENHLLDQALQSVYAGLPQIVLHRVEFLARNGIARISFTIEARDEELIDQIEQDLRQLPGRTINSVRQMQLLLSEREELARPTRPATFNPYRRLPVRNREMFFGRAEELAHILDLLQTGTGVVYVRGEKRVGKTSLLLYLKEHYLERANVVPIFIDCQLLSSLAGPDFFCEIANAVYAELQADSRIGDVGPPLRELFETAAPTEFIAYLKSVQSYFGSTKLVLLMDEFSRTIDAYHQEQVGEQFFQQWRGILQATMPYVSYLMVIQQQTYDSLVQRLSEQILDPSSSLVELGETILLKPLSEKDARQLIERPTHNYLDYSPRALRYVWRLTGGSPFLIHAFCFNLVSHMASIGSRRVDWEEVDTVQQDFMGPNENLFAHLLDMMGEAGRPICQQLSQFLNETEEPVPLAKLQGAETDVPPERLLKTVQELADRHILTEPKPGCWQFASLLFGRWLARNITSP